MYTDVAQNLDVFVIKYPKTIVPSPDDSDYNAGLITRYFTRKATDENGHIFELSQDTYNEYLSNPFWTSTEIQWRIAGSITPIFGKDGKIVDKGVIEGNKAEISKGAINLKNLSLYLPNLMQFYKG